MALINRDLRNNWDKLLVQEPHTNYYSHIMTPNGFRQIYPTNDLWKKRGVRSTIWVNANISTNSWKAIIILDMTDIMAIQIDTNTGQLTSTMTAPTITPRQPSTDTWSET